MFRLHPLSLVCSAALALALVPACVVSSADTAEGEGEGEGEELPPKCTEATEVPCRDDALQALNMNLTDVTPGEIVSESDGTGTFEVDVDASAGGFGGDGGFVYGRFTDEGLVKVELLDDESFDSMAWDIAFRRFVVRLNSGPSGPSCVTGARTGPSTDFDALDIVSSDLTFHAEQFMSEADDCTLVPDGSGLGSPGVVLQNWWEYPSPPGCVATTGNVYVLSLANGRFVKLVVTQYYGEGQDACDARQQGFASETSGHIHLRYAFLD
jgi:hypothetical protein